MRAAKRRSCCPSCALSRCKDHLIVTHNPFRSFAIPVLWTSCLPSGWHEVHVKELKNLLPWTSLCPYHCPDNADTLYGCSS